MRSSLPYIAVSLIGIQLLLILVSWLLSAVMPDSGISSLISSEGVRWYFGQWVDWVASPVLVWIILASSAWGVARSQLLTLRRPLSYRDRMALRLACVLIIIYIAVIAMLAFVPHAVLLSVSGSLFPSPFSASIVPIVLLGVIVFAVTFSLVSGRMTLTAVYDSLISGISNASHLILFYILLIQIYYSFMFVFF